MPLFRMNHSIFEPLALAALLLFGLACPGAEVVLCLQDHPSIESELARSDARGYYETLLDQSPTNGRNSPHADPVPPPGWSTFADSGAVELDPTYLRWCLKPNLDLVWNATRIRTNHLGHRSPEISIPKPANTFRIVVLGSSNTMGHGVNDEDIYVRRLERYLNALPFPPDLHFEVVNLAVSSDSPSQRLLRLRQDVPPLQPDWIVCDATVIDVSLEEIHLETIVKNRVPIPLDYVRQAIQKAGVSCSDDSQTIQSRLRSQYEPLLNGAWAGWSAEARRLGVPLTVVLLPRADAKARAPRIEALFHTLADRHQLDLIDLSAVFDDLSVDQFRVSPWDQHPNVLGHLMIFEALRDVLESRGRLPGLALPPSPYLPAPVGFGVQDDARRPRTLSGKSRS